MLGIYCIPPFSDHFPWSTWSRKHVLSSTHCSGVPDQNKLNNLFIYLLFLVYLFKMGTTKRWLKWLTWTLKRSVLLRFGAGDFKSETFSLLITLQFHSSTPGANWLPGEGMQALALFISQCCQISNGWTTVIGHHLSNSFRTQWKRTALKAINCQYAST